jgi:hypothetical protein
MELAAEGSAQDFGLVLFGNFGFLPAYQQAGKSWLLQWG